MSAETSTIDLGAEKSEEEEKKKDEEAEGEVEKKKSLTEEEAKDLCAWLATTLGSQKVKQVKLSKRLSDSPAIVTDHESGALRRMMKLVVCDFSRPISLNFHYGST